MNDEKDNQQVKAETEPSLDMNLRSDEDNQYQNAQQEETSKPEIKEEAKQFGHISKEEWIKQGRDPDKWKSPEKFVEYGRNYAKSFDELKSAVEQLRQENKELVDYHKKTVETSYFQAKKDIEARLQAAMAAGNAQAVRQLTEQQKDMEYQQKQKEIETFTKQVERVNADFLARNKDWYNNDHPELIAEANQLANSYLGLGKTYEEAAQEAEKIVKLRHPEINKTITPPVTFSNTRSNINKSIAETSITSESRQYKSLTPDQQSEYNEIKKQVESLNDRFPNKKVKTTYTVEDYLQATTKH